VTRLQDGKLENISIYFDFNENEGAKQDAFWAINIDTSLTNHPSIPNKQHVIQSLCISMIFLSYPNYLTGRAFIHLLSSQSPSHLLFGQVSFNFMSLHLERLGRKFATLYRPSLSLFLTPCL
jgi:hypothetical protein